MIEIEFAERKSKKQYRKIYWQYNYKNSVYFHNLTEKNVCFKATLYRKDYGLYRLKVVSYHNISKIRLVDNYDLAAVKKLEIATKLLNDHIEKILMF